MLTKKDFENFGEFERLDENLQSVVVRFFNVADDWTFEQKVWKNGRKTKNSDELAKILMDESWPFNYSSTLQSLKFIENNYESLLNILKPADGYTNSIKDDFEKRFYEVLVEESWSEVDRIAWKNIKYTSFEDNTLILAPTGNGKEYKVIGQDYREVYKGFVTLGHLKYINTHVLKKLNKMIFGQKFVDISEITSDNLPGSISQTLYRPKAVWGEKSIEGMTFQTNNNAKISVEDYIKKSMEIFLTNPENEVVIKNVISNDPNEPTFRYISLDITPGEWSTWKNWMNDTFEQNQITNDLFMAWIASVIVAKNNSKQVLYIQGQGSDGKTQVINALTEYLGKAATAIDKNSMSNQFGFAKIENKRLVTISDNKNPELIKTGFIHKITGGDTVDIERKNKDSYSAKMFAKILVAENIAPNIDADEVNQLHRLIYIKCKKRSEEECVRLGIGRYNEDGDYEFLGSEIFPKKLIEETEAFLHECLKVYAKKCPTDSMISVPKSYIENNIKPACGDIIGNMDIDTLEKAFEKSEGDYVENEEFWKHVEKVFGNRFQMNNKYQMANIKKLAENMFNTECIQKRIGGERLRVYINLKIIPTEFDNQMKKYETPKPKEEKPKLNLDWCSEDTTEPEED